jgi:heat shock protein HtpX
MNNITSSQSQTSHLFETKSSNSAKTFLLMAGIFGLLGVVGYVFSIQSGNPLFLYGAIGIGIIANISSYWFSKTFALRSAGAVPVDTTTPEGRSLYAAVDRISKKAGILTPEVYIIEDSQMNAFATGRNQANAAVAFTRGILNRLNQEELDGVIAHELAHIGNKDILISSIVAVMAGVLVHITQFGGMGHRDEEHRGNALFALLAMFLAPLAATIIQMSVSRSREFVADATAGIITGNPEGLARALEKIHDNNHEPLMTADNATAHMYISNPFGSSMHSFSKLFASHPPVEERLARLRGINVQA